MLDLSSRPAPLPLVMDALSQVLQDFRLSGVNYGRCELRHPWSIGFPHQDLLRFHFVSEGPCFIHTEAQGWQQLHDGDLVLLPQGIAHRLASSPHVVNDCLKDCQVVGLGGNVCEVVREGTGATSTLFCGSMVLDAYALHPLINLMPPLIKGCDVAANDPIIGPLLEAMTAEASQPRMGSATILSRMADLLTARLIRCWVDCTGSSTIGWLAAIRDPHLGRVLAAMHRDSRPWLDSRKPGRAGRPIALGLRRALQCGPWRRGGALSHTPAHAACAGMAGPGRPVGRRGRCPAGVSVGSVVRACVQARYACLARRCAAHKFWTNSYGIRIIGYRSSGMTRLWRAPIQEILHVGHGSPAIRRCSDRK